MMKSYVRPSVYPFLSLECALTCTAQQPDTFSYGVYLRLESVSEFCHVRHGQGVIRDSLTASPCMSRVTTSRACGWTTRPRPGAQRTDEAVRTRLSRAPSQ